MKLFDLATFYTQPPQLISGTRLSFKKLAQNPATQLYLIDSETVVALVKTRSLLKSNQLKGYTAEAELTYTTWPR